MITAVTAMPAISGMPVSSDRPMAPPRNSARSVAIAAISLMPQRARRTGREVASRQCSARFLPVTMPSLAESAWNSIAVRLASSTTQSSP